MPAAFLLVVHVKNWKIVEGSAGSLSDKDGDGNENGKKKIIRMTLARQQLRTCITIFSTLIYLTTKTWNCLISLLVKTLSICQNWPVGPLPDQPVSNRNRLSPRVFFFWKTISFVIMFRIKVKFSLWREWSGRPVLTNGKRPKALLEFNSRKTHQHLTN